MFKKNTICITCLFILFFSTLAVVLYQCREAIHIPDFTLDPVRKEGGNITCLIVTSIGRKNLRVGFSIPSKNKRQKEHLLGELPRIRHDLLVSATTSDLVSHYEERNFEAIKRHLLRVVNTHADRPIKTIYFESFFYD